MLNEKQKEVVEYVDGPCIVTSGPGTGKTTLIVSKIKHLVENCNYGSDEILALTFTEKAANEMKERLGNEISGDFTIKTFHSFALDILDEFSHEAKLRNNFNLMDEINSILFFMQNISKFKFSSINVKKDDSLAYELNSTISKLKDFGITLNDLVGLDMDITQKSDLVPIYVEYEKYKSENNLIDFSDVLLLTLNLLNSNENVLKKIQSRFKYVLVDEFQDTNLVQLEILKFLTKKNITVVGDLKQSIYSFRGANYKNLEEFKKYYKNHKEFFITLNYRFSSSVLNNVNKLVSNFGNKNELLDSSNNEIGEVKLLECETDKSLLTYVLERVNEIRDLHSNTKNVGILCRRKSEVNLITKYLKSYGIEIKKAEIDDFFSTQIIKNLINYIKSINYPRGNNIEIYKILRNSGISNEVIQFISRKASRDKCSIYEIISIENLSDNSEESKHINQIYEKIERLNNLIRNANSIRELVFEIISEFNFYSIAQISNEKENVFLLNSFLDFCDKFTKIYRTNDLEKFLNVCNLAKNFSLKLDCDLMNDDNNLIEVLTIHQSKGKEFDYVIMPFINERRFPLKFRNPIFELPFGLDKNKFLDEELRLFFVGVSRAKLSLDLLYVKKFSDNKLDSKPSDFLSYLNLNVLRYSKEMLSLNLDVKENIKVDVLRKINEYVLNNKFDLAKSQLDLLNNLFGKKDLNAFLNVDKNSNVKEYQDMLNRNHDNFELVKFDSKNQVYSVSQLQTYDLCPKKYLYNYVYRIPSKSRHYFDFGTSVHSALELLANDFEDVKTKEELYTLGVSYLTNNWISKGYLSHEQEEEYMQKGLNAISDFIDKELELKNEDSSRRIISQEERFDIEIDGRKLMGFIDRIDRVGDNEFEILDYKTSNSMELLSKIPTNMQLLVYSIAMKENPKYNKFPKSVGLWYVIHNKILKTKPSLENIDLIKSKIKSLMLDIENKKFDAKPSSFGCRFCDFNEICDQSQTK